MAVQFLGDPSGWTVTRRLQRVFLTLDGSVRLGTAGGYQLSMSSIVELVDTPVNCGTTALRRSVCSMARRSAVPCPRAAPNIRGSMFPPAGFPGKTEQVRVQTTTSACASSKRRPLIRSRACPAACKASVVTRTQSHGTILQ